MEIKLSARLSFKTEKYSMSATQKAFDILRKEGQLRSDDNRFPSRNRVAVAVYSLKSYYGVPIKSEYHHIENTMRSFRIYKLNY